MVPVISKCLLYLLWDVESVEQHHVLEVKFLCLFAYGKSFLS